ncbi:MAG: hypothetical protein RMJ18_03015 [Candidatus Aenigmarchaeota archaeon]|nr:hypothetical protein [Candidatus Aenigmarchaeota archaeon]MDW8160361.1 hypothetical protein [Candidatus Aenigmarchaeota archaeon]
MFFKKEKDITTIEEKLNEIEKRVKDQKKMQEVQKIVPQPQQKEIKEDIETLKEENTQPSIKTAPKKVEEEVSVPLFVKLEKYKNIVSALMQIKTYLITLKNSLVALEHIEKARSETLSMLSKNLDKIGEKINELERDLVKPIGFSFGSPETFEELSSVHTNLAALKAQIEQLKTELEKA